MILLRWNEEWTQWEAVDIKDNSYIPVNMPHRDLISYLKVESFDDGTKITYTSAFKSEVIYVHHEDGIIGYKHEIPLV